MAFVAKQAIAMLVVGAALAHAAARAQIVPQSDADHRAGAAAPAERAVQPTGKERLGEKWEDEQRVDNCKVPPEKRGSKPRPDSCAHVPAR